MPLVVPAEGENQLLTWALQSTTISENCTLKLFTNNYTPVSGSTAASFTECSISGYSAKTLTRGSFTTPSQNGSSKAESGYAQQTFNFTGSGTVYGYYVVSASGNKVLWAELFSTSRTVASGDALNVTPKLTFNSEN